MASAASAVRAIVSTPWIWAYLAISIAAGIGITSTATLDVPPEVDHYRDMGAAHALLSGRFGEDPAFLGETAWYPPLLPMVMAGASLALSQPLPWVYVHFGPILNAAAPVAFYALVRYIVGGWAAVYAVVAFLFLANWRMDTWTLASYSPWAWPVLFAQTLFYLALKAWLVATESWTFRDTPGAASTPQQEGLWRRPLVASVVAGLLVGLTFLAHPAPAVLLVLITVVTSVARAVLRPHERLAALYGLCITGATAALVCAPFLVPLITRYGMVTQNPVPSRYGGIWFGNFVDAHITSRAIGAALGLLYLLTSKRKTGAWLWQGAVLTGAGASLAGVAYGMAAQIMEPRGITLPMLFPTFHWLFYLLAFEALLCGIGFSWVLDRVTPVFGRHAPSLAPFFAVLTWVTLVVSGLPGYLLRDDYNRWPIESRIMARDVRVRSLYGWANANLAPDDVVLADVRTSMFAVVASGHAITATLATMTNPYVALEPREQARDAMFAALRVGDLQGFLSRARQFGVTHVIAEHSYEPCCWLDAARIRELPVAFETAGATVFSVPSR